MKRSPAAALWLSLLPGAGHVYLGQPVKGAVLILLLASLFQIMDHGADAFGIVIPFFWLYAMLDAYRTAVEHNHAVETGRAPAATATPGTAVPKWWGGILIALGVIFLAETNDWVDFDFIWDFWPLGLVAAGIYILMRKDSESPGPRPRSETAAPPPPPPDDEKDGSERVDELRLEGDAENA